MTEEGMSKYRQQFGVYLNNLEKLKEFDEEYEVPPHWFVPTNNPERPFLYNFPLELSVTEALAIVGILKNRPPYKSS